MGIQGLTSALRGYMIFRDGEFIRDSDVYIDGKNFVHSGAEFFASRGPLAIMQENLRVLESLEPYSITIYFDASFPIDKIPAKFSRCAQKLREKTWDNLTEGTALLIDEIQLNHPQISVVMTGTEAEDQIFWDLAQKNGIFDRPQLVLSSDSDCFTFDVPGSEYIEIVSLDASRNWPSQFMVYKLGDVARSSRVARYLHVPQEPMATTIRDCSNVDIRTVELVNMKQLTGRAIMFLSLLPTNLQDPWQYGEKWRKAAYYKLLGPDEIVQEYRQALHMMERNDVAVCASHVRALINEYKSRDLADIVTDEVYTAKIPEKLDASNKPKFKSYYKSLEYVTEFNIQSTPTYCPGFDYDLYGKCEDWCLVAAAVTSSIKMFASANGLEWNTRNVWKLNPNELYKHLKEVPTEV